MITDHINQHPDLQGIKFPEIENSIDDGDLGREYYLKDVPGVFFSVTTALKHIVPQKLQNYMQKYSANRQQKALKNAGDVGTALHDAMEAHFMGRLPLLVQEHKKAVKDEYGNVVAKEIVGFDIRKAFENFLVLVDKHRIKPVFIEDYVANKFLGVSGKFDLIGEFESQLTLMDLKSGFLGKKAGWQMAAYCLMFEEMYKKQTGKEIDLGMVALHVPRDGSEAKSFVYEHKRYCLKKFLCSLETFKGLNDKYLREMNWPQLDNWSMDLL